MNTSNDSTAKRPAEEVLRAHVPRPLVRRLNRKAVAVLIILVVLVFAGRLILGLFRREAARIADGESHRSSIRHQEGLVGRGVIDLLPSDYRFAIPPPPPPVKPEPPPVIEEDIPPPLDPDALKRQEALRRENEAAMDSPIRFEHIKPISSQFEEESSDDSEQIHRLPKMEPGANAPDPRSLDVRRRDFFREATNVATYTRSHLLPPRSAYEIKAGSIVPAALVTAINSDLPGDVVGQVTVNVYDSVSGDYLLIPQGSRLIGRYDSEVHKGHNRVLIAWQRLILPNGHSIVLEAMPGTDATGVAGMADKVDWHAKRLVGATFLSTLISLGGNYAANVDREKEELTVLAETATQDAARVGGRVIERELDLAPTILISAGTPFNVLVNKDLEMDEFKPAETRRP